MRNIRAVIVNLMFLAASCLGAQGISVANTDELTEAVGSNRTVVLAPGEYMVSEVAQIGNPAVSWEQIFDGTELTITGASNLTLRAPRGATLLASPRYAFTLVFIDCHNLTLEGLTVGHTDAGECIGGVLRFERCTEVRVDRCELFGSGVVGIQADDCSGLRILTSIIRDCTQGAVWADRVQDMLLEGVWIHGNESWPLVYLGSSRGVVFESCRIENNFGGELLWMDGDSDLVSLPRTIIEGNEADSLLHEEGMLPDLSETVIQDNTFTVEDMEEGPWFPEDEYYPEEEWEPEAE